MEPIRETGSVLEPGTLFAGRYRIVTQIGRGGMGRVYLAEDMRLNGKRLALKLTAAPETEREAFIREARILAELQHPLLPGIADYYPPDDLGIAAIVMDYIPGDSLAELFGRCGNRLPFERVLHYLGQLCGLLCYLHGRKPMIVFRDLKPANVLIDRQDRAVLVDFGIARTHRPGAPSDTERLGTPAFAAPEQLRGEQTDARSDIYSWGALAYHLLSGGNFAYRRKDAVHRIVQSDVPADFCGLLEDVLDEDPGRRPRNTADLMQLLRKFERTDTFIGEPVECPESRTDGVNVAAVLSAYPGAGATFSVVGLSRYLAARGMPNALVEFPGGEAELYALLNGHRLMPKFAVYADPTGQGDALPSWQHGQARIYPLDPLEPTSRPDPAFANWIRRLGVPLVLLDVSCRWESPPTAEWLTGSGIQSMWWVADCLPAKWSSRRRSAAEEIQLSAAAKGIRTGWIANRDHLFPERKEWLSCFPVSPVAGIPQMPPEDVVRAIWRGDGWPTRTQSASSSGKAFQMWSKAVIESHGR